MSGLAHLAGTEGTAEWIAKSPEHLSITSEQSALYFEHQPGRLHWAEAQEEPVLLESMKTKTGVICNSASKTLTPELKIGPKNMQKTVSPTEKKNLEIVLQKLAASVTHHFKQKYEWERQSFTISQP